MDDLAALRLQVEWGADEALDDAPIDRFALPAPVSRLADAIPVARLPTPALLRPGAGPALPEQAAAAAAAATDLDSLHMALDAFDACALRGTASHTVRPSGNPDGGLLMLGEMPGPEDDRSGQAYSGLPGQIMDRVLRSAGLGRDTALLGFVVPWRTPGGRPPSEMEVATCLPFARRLLALVRPRVVVLMGGGALKALIPGAGTLRQARGRWTELQVTGAGAVAVLPMLPADLWLRTAGNRQATWTDLLALATHDHSATN